MFERLRLRPGGIAYGTLIFELFIVVIGILIAFQIDRWAEERRDRQLERDYLERLKSDLEIEVEQMSRALEHARARVGAAKFIEQFASDPSVAADRPGDVAPALEKVAWRSFPQINAFVYSELQSTGNLALLQSEELRRELAVHYQTIDQHARVGLDRELQKLFERLTAGILTTEELESIELRSWDGRRNDESESRAREIAVEVARRQDAVVLLPSIAQHNVFNAKVILETRERALRLIARIDRILKAEPPAPPRS